MFAPTSLLCEQACCLLQIGNCSNMNLSHVECIIPVRTVLPLFCFHSGIDFRELSPQELGGLADQLESRISVHLPHFTRILLGSLPRFHSGGTGALKRFQRENAIDSEVLALLRLWISEPNIACTGLAFYEALRQVGDGLAASCQNLLWVRIFLGSVRIRSSKSQFPSPSESKPFQCQMVSWRMTEDEMT